MYRKQICYLNTSYCFYGAERKVYSNKHDLKGTVF